MTGARWSIAGQVTTVACHLAQLLVLARLLTASDFGVGAIFLLLVSAGQIFWDFGTSAALVQRRELRQEQLASLLLLNIALALAAAALIWTCAPAVGRALDHPDATSVLRWAAAVPLVAALGGQSRALHLRQMRFRQIALIDIAIAVTSCSAGIVAALLGLGALAFACATVAGAVTGTALIVASALRSGMQVPVRRFEPVAPALRFGGYQTGSAFITFASLNLDVLLLGGLLGAAELGKYAFAKQLCVGALEAIRPVLVRGMLPQMARLQDDVAAMRAHYLGVFKVLNALCVPAFAALVVTAAQLVPVVFGPKWQDSAVLVQLLAVAHLVRFLMVPAQVSLVATGRVFRGFLWDFGVTCLLAAMVILCRPHSAAQMAVILVGLYASALLLHWYLLVRDTLRLPLVQWASAIARPLAISIAAALLGVVSARLVSGAGAGAAVTLTVGLLSYSALSFWFNKPAIVAAGLMVPVRSAESAPELRTRIDA